MITVRADIKGTGTIVNIRRSGNTRIIIDLDQATPKDLKMLHEMGHPFVEEVKQEAKLKAEK